MSDNPKKPNEDDKNKGARQPDPEAPHTTDPQEDMKGPISTFMQKIKKNVKDNDDKEQEEHEHKKNTTGGDFINE